MLQATRLQPHFDFIGDKTRHFGIFPGCGVPLPFTGGAEPSTLPSATSSGACC
jgi:arsenite methyltransferase